MKHNTRIISSVATSLLCATALTAGIFGLAAANRADAAEADPMSPENYFSTTVDISKDQPATVPFEGVTANSRYMLAVDPWYGSSEGTVYTAALNGGTALTLESNENMYGSYINYFNLPATSGTFTITTTETSSTTINVSLYAEVVAEALPDAEHKATMTAYETYTYKYSFTGTSGYYAFNPNVTGLGKDQQAYFGIERKLDANYFVGEPVSVGEPVWYDNGTDYYFSVQYLGGDLESPITAYFTIDAWTPGDIELGRNFYTLVVPSNSRDVYSHLLIDMSGEYLLNFSSLPEAAYGATITAYVGEDEMPYTVDPFGGTRITIAAGDSIFFTSTNLQTFAASAVINKAPSPSVNFTVGTSAKVDLKANETLECAILNVGETANYQITLSGLTGSPVKVRTIYNDIVLNDNTGMFPIVLAYPNEYGYPGEKTVDVAIIFENTTAEAVTFNAKIEKAAKSYTVKSGDEITIGMGESVTYFAELKGGSYLVSATDTEGGITIADYFNSYPPMIQGGVTEGLTTFGVASSETVLKYAFIVTNTGDKAITFAIDFTEVNSIALGENTITANDNTTYYLGGVTTGSYKMTLSEIPEGATVTVKDQGGNVIVSNTQLSGVFAVETPKDRLYTLVSFTVEAAAGTTFKLDIQSTVDGTMEVGKAQNVTLGVNDTEESYNIDLKQNVEYKVTLEGTIPADTTLYVLVNGIMVSFDNNVGTFTIGYEITETPIISFSYFYSGIESVSDINITVTVSESSVN